jgi:hypothetical protein
MLLRICSFAFENRIYAVVIMLRRDIIILPVFILMIFKMKTGRKKLTYSKTSLTFHFINVTTPILKIKVNMSIL